MRWSVWSGLGRGAEQRAAESVGVLSSVDRLGGRGGGLSDSRPQVCEVLSWGKGRSASSAGSRVQN